MKKQLLLLAMILLPLVASAHDIEVKNADGVTIYYSFYNNGKELRVTYCGFYKNRYQGKVSIPEEVEYMGNTYKVTSIGQNAFSECTAITSVVIGNNVKSIEYKAFLNCYGLTSINIGSSVTSINEVAFSGCSSLISIVVDSDNRIFDSRNNCNAIINTSLNSLVIGCKNTIISNGVMSIGAYAFSGRTGLTSITIPNSVKSIGNNAFYNCYGLTSIVIPNSVTSIGRYAFSGCSGLTSVTIPNSVMTIGSYAFDGCTNLNKVIINDIESWCNISFYDKWANPLSHGGHLYSDNNTEIKDLIIPNSVTSIGTSAFYGCSGLTSVTIPSSVTTIEENAFSHCTGLNSVNIGNSVTSINEVAFSGCSSLISIVVDSDNRIFDSRNNCNAIINTSLNSLVIGCKNTIIPNSVTSIGTSAFYGCSTLTSITIPNSVTSIGEYAFGDCTGLTSITIPNSMTSIGNSVFLRCTGLTSITIPNSVTSIGNNVFWQCTGLTSITIPNSVTSIGGDVFYDCTSLTDVTCMAESVPKTDPRAFYNFSINNATLHVPASSVDAYKAAYLWMNFGKIVGDATSNITRINTDATLIQCDGGVFKVQSVDEGTQVNVYGINGTQAGSAISQSGAATINTNLQPGSIAIVKIGQKSVKVAIK